MEELEATPQLDPNLNLGGAPKSSLNLSEVSSQVPRQSRDIGGPNDRLSSFYLESTSYFLEAFQEYQAVFVVSFQYLVCLDTLVYMLISTGSTLFYYYFHHGSEAAEFSWVFFSFVIVFPITWNISEAYKRRERALNDISYMKALLNSLYISHRDWDFGTTKEWGWRSNVKGGWDFHTTQVRNILLELSSAIKDFLLLPCANDLRHMHTKAGRKERKTIMSRWRLDICRIELCVNKLSLAVEILKSLGLPGNEAARMNQYIMLFQGRFHSVRYVKGYRTIAGIQSYAKFFVFLHPLFYGSYYAYLGYQIHIAWSIFFSYFIGFAMIGLINIATSLQDPYSPKGLDRIRVEKIFRELDRDLQVQHMNYHDVIKQQVSLEDAIFQGCQASEMSPPDPEM